MNLREVLIQIDSLNDEAGICARLNEKIDLESDVAIQEPQGEDDPVPPEGMYEVMGVYHAQETLNGLRQLLKGQTGKVATEEELFNRFIVYLENGA